MCLCFAGDRGMLRDHIVFATNSEVMHTKCLEVGDKLTLQQACQFALTHEHTQWQLKKMCRQTSGTKNIHSVKKCPQTKHKLNKSSKVNNTSPATTTKCGHSNNKCFNGGGNCHSVSYHKPYVNGTVVPLVAQHGCSVPLKVDTGADVSI